MKANEGGISGPKSIPNPATITTPFDAAVFGDTNGGSSDAVLVDFAEESFHEGLLLIECQSVNGAGETPTAPGTSKTLTVNAAFCDDGSIALADAPTILTAANLITASVVLPNSPTPDATGTRIFQSDVSIHRGRFAYVWYKWDALADANSKVALTVKFIRL